MGNNGIKSMNNCKILKYCEHLSKLFLLIVFFTYSLVLGQDIKEKKIISKEYGIFDSIKVIEDSTFFEGYLIFKIDKNPDTLIYKADNEFYICDIFWIKNLKNINQDTSFYYYNFYTLLYYQYVVNNDYLQNNSIEYIRFKNYFNKYSPTFNYAASHIMQILNTFIFKTVVFWNYGPEKKVGYYIYNVSLYGSVISASVSTYSKNNDNETIIQKFFIPLSKFSIFSQTSSLELLKLGFKKSKWHPKNLYGK